MKYFVKIHATIKSACAFKSLPMVSITYLCKGNQTLISLKNFSKAPFDILKLFVWYILSLPYLEMGKQDRGKTQANKKQERRILSPNFPTTKKLFFFHVTNENSLNHTIVKCNEIAPFPGFVCKVKIIKEKLQIINCSWLGDYLLENILCHLSIMLNTGNLSSIIKAKSYF